METKVRTDLSLPHRCTRVAGLGVLSPFALPTPLAILSCRRKTMSDSRMRISSRITWPSDISNSIPIHLSGLYPVVGGRSVLFCMCYVVSPILVLAWYQTHILVEAKLPLASKQRLRIPLPDGQSFRRVRGLFWSGLVWPQLDCLNGDFPATEVAFMMSRYVRRMSNSRQYPIPLSTGT